MSDDFDDLGLSINFREKASGFCLEMKIFISEEMEAEGLTGLESVTELQKRCDDVMAGLRDCPAAATCRKYKRSVENGRADRFGVFGKRSSEVVQLPLF